MFVNLKEFGIIFLDFKSIFYQYPGIILELKFVPVSQKEELGKGKVAVQQIAENG